MTVPDAPTPAPQPWPAEMHTPKPPAGVRAVDGNRAALGLLVIQNVVSALLIAQRVPLGTALLGSFVVVVAAAFIFFRPTVRALAQDTRWRTPPSWGLALAAFVLAFLASRAFALAYITLFPSAADSVPQFLSSGPDLWALLLAAGLLIPFAEEVAFRGLLMRGHERAAGFTVAALTSTFAFSVAHGVPASIAGILPLAYVLARVVQHSGSLWNSVIIHVLNNTLAVGLGAFVAGKKLGDTAQATELLSNPALRLPLALGALLFGTVVLVVLHLWLTPRPDVQERSASGPWLSLAYVVIVLFGGVAVALTFPQVSLWFTDLRSALF
ncbi:CPBP family intramembrane glutamic endopeptidase [Deinococcus arenicola]|uniref:Type II CAAX endopeptidase family protein n=1 Tax=Deinococcus arenicola TaxID=2994950 RepID=A0ABU4DNV9_9DEIO|nr:type II CAAX endopeptidase family protein [Deinococcus sp. ZS9-10]MDV6374123.1 type II CAAX endopeptidase family protein [Deinococcus sp. ZS9-10]